MPFDPKRSREPQLVYVKVIKSEAAASWYRAIPLLKRGQDIFGLHAADGTLLAIADSRETAMAGAASLQFQQSAFIKVILS